MIHRSSGFVGERFGLRVNSEFPRPTAAEAHHHTHEDFRQVRGGIGCWLLGCYRQLPPTVYPKGPCYAQLVYTLAPIHLYGDKLHVKAKVYNISAHARLEVCLLLNFGTHVAGPSCLRKSPHLKPKTVIQNRPKQKTLKHSLQPPFLHC